MRRDKAGGKVAKTQRLKTLKRHNAPKISHRGISLEIDTAFANRRSTPSAPSPQMANVRYWHLADIGADAFPLANSTDTER
jgi:hypothetical protein